MAIKLKVDKDILILIFLQDNPFTVTGEAYLDLQTGDILPIADRVDVFDEELDLEELLGWEREPIEEIRKEPKRYLKLKPPSHGMWHEAYQEWGQLPYWGTIGGSLKEAENEEYRYDWHNFQYKKALEFAEQFLKSNGVEYELI